MFGFGSGRSPPGRVAPTTPPGPAPPTPIGHPFSLPFSGLTPAQGQDGNSLDSVNNTGSSIPFSVGLRSPGKVSPLRGRTMKEYEEQLATLKKENFSLKLRIYFLEERIGQKGEKEDKEELYKTNIELKVETEALKRELYDKQELVRQASTALSGLEQQHQEQVSQLKGQHQQEKEELSTKIDHLQKEVNDYAERVREENGRLGELTQLCGLAFNTGGDEDDLGVTQPPSGHETPSLSSHLLPGHEGSFTAPSPMQGIFSIPAKPSDPAANVGTPLTQQLYSPSKVNKNGLQSMPGDEEGKMAVAEEEAEANKVTTLEAQVAELEARVTELETELAAREEANTILEGDIANLKKELEEKVEKIGDLEVEVAEKDLKIDDVMQELETRHMEIQAKDDQIESLHQDLNKVEPEIEVKVQEIVERDRIIEEKIEQIEQQNKILVEIQITLDEKQKQIADMEHKITESSEKIHKLSEELDFSIKTIQGFAKEVQTRDEEIAALKKEVKRKEKKIRDLVAELKEALDMLNKAKWEAETSGGEDGVKEMAEEENERLWAELESRKNEVLALRADHKHSLSEAEDRVRHLQEQLDEKLRALDGQRNQHQQDMEEREAKLRDQAQQVARLEGELKALQEGVSTREDQLHKNQDLVQNLKDELTLTKEQLQEKRGELSLLQEELKKKNADMQDLVNRELWERNKEVERLQEKLSALTSDRRQQIQGLQDELEAKTNELRRLKTQRLVGENTDDNINGSSSSSQRVAASVVCVRTDANQNIPGGETIINNQQPKNAAHLTIINNTTTCGPDMSTSSRPMHLSLVDNNDATSIQMLYHEMSMIRSDAQALRLERSILNDKLSSLQKLSDQVFETNDASRASSELREQMDAIKKQLEETKEECILKDRKHGQVVSDFQTQVQTLHAELHNAKKKIGRQLTEVTVRKYQDSLKRHKQEIASLRKRLADSHNACDLLRTRLEELADFLERILEMDERGLINLSQLSPKQLSALHKTLNDSRALSRSLSQSLMIGMDTTEIGDDALLSSSVSSVSSFSLHRDDSLSEPHDNAEASSHEAIANLPDESIFQPDHDSHDPAVQALATQLNTQIDQKSREIDAIAENVSVLSTQLAERTRQVEQQAAVIGELRGQVGRLQDEVRHRDLQLLASQADQDQGGSQPTLHGSWQSSINPLAASSQSTVHAASPQNTVHAHDSSSQERLQKSPSTCSDTLPPPPLHLLQDSECEELRPDISRELEICQVSDRSSLSAVKSAYSTDAAIKAHSGHPGYFQQLAAPTVERNRADGRKQQQQQQPWGEAATGANGYGIPEQQPWAAPVSPSESEAWSEPDRNVSLARIGLDTCTLGGAPDRALSRSRQQRASAAITSESEGEVAHEDTATCITNPASTTPGKTPKRRSDIAELRRVSTKLRAVEQLNDTLRAELNIYQTLSQQMVKQQDQEQRPKTSDKSVETHKGETADASVGAEVEQTLVPPPPIFSIPAPLLEEIRALRLKLEEAIANNDHLRDQLEAALTAHPQDEARFHHLTAALQTAQEEMKEARDRLQMSQETLREQQDEYSQLHHRLQECENRLSQTQALLETAEGEVKATRADLRSAHLVIQEKDALVEQRDARLSEKETITEEMMGKVSQLESALATRIQDHDRRVQELQTELQKQESRLLQVNKERLALVGERARLQAQLASVSTQARLLQTEQQEGVDQDRASLLKELEAEKVTVVTLRQEQQQLLLEKESLEKKQQLSSEEKHHLEKEKKLLQEELESVRLRTEHLTTITQQTRVSRQIETELHDVSALRTAHTSLQEAYNELQTNLEHCREELLILKKKRMTEEEERNSTDNAAEAAAVKQLTAQLESERCLTANLQLQLDAFRGNASPPSQFDSSIVPHTSDLASPDSVTSIEFFRPASETTGLRERRPASLGPSSPPKEKEKVRERRASSSSRRRDGNKRISNHWSEDKENLQTSTTTITTTTTVNSSSSKRNRRLQNSLTTEGVLLEQVPIAPSLTDHHHHHQQDEEGDGGTTSGESPDLGIGSDYHFSSLERGARTLRSLAQTANDLPPQPPLCSEPSHSALCAENRRLRIERENLTEKLASTKDTLKDALEKLSKANHRKETVERAICKQLTKTHNVLKKAKGNLQEVRKVPSSVD